MANKWGIGLLLLLALLTGIYLFNKYRVPPGIKFDSLSLSTLDGKPVYFKDYKGTKTVVCFSASWCGTCWQELKTINKIKNSELNDVNVLIVSDEPVEKIALFEQKFGNAFICLKLNTSLSNIGIHTFPTSYVLNKNLEVKKEKAGYIDWGDPSTLQHLKKLME